MIIWYLCGNFGTSCSASRFKNQAKSHLVAKSVGEYACSFFPHLLKSKWVWICLIVPAVWPDPCLVTLAIDSAHKHNRKSHSSSCTQCQIDQSWSLIRERRRYAGACRHVANYWLLKADEDTTRIWRLQNPHTDKTRSQMKNLVWPSCIARTHEHTTFPPVLVLWCYTVLNRSRVAYFPKLPVNLKTIRVYYLRLRVWIMIAKHTRKKRRLQIEVAVGILRCLVTPHTPSRAQNLKYLMASSC
jgi:hypothetical protein